MCQTPSLGRHTAISAFPSPSKSVLVAARAGDAKKLETAIATVSIFFSFFSLRELVLEREFKRGGKRCRVSQK